MTTLETRLYGSTCSINSNNFMNNLTWNANINIIKQMFKNVDRLIFLKRTMLKKKMDQPLIIHKTIQAIN
jgi:hypothetical protein